ncbi:hypothetical protein [Fusobacterium periodonticum]|uniref:hypothetical protein n=1 Tax=Fusobacterium periodonticum TaxID=860 RepID=UPI00195BD18F|nr:hypothetical protein [Fusobacterium periodonticum]VTX62513.1 Uncharacterised protein [Fusobacterium periodonticum]
MKTAIKNLLIQFLLWLDNLPTKLLNFKEKHSQLINKIYNITLGIIFILFFFLKKLIVTRYFSYAFFLLVVLFIFLIIIKFIDSVNSVIGALKSLFFMEGIFIISYLTLFHNNFNVFFFHIYISCIWFLLTLLLKKEVSFIINNFLIGIVSFIRIILKYIPSEVFNTFKIPHYKILDNTLEYYIAIYFFSLFILELKKYYVNKYASLPNNSN